MRTFVIGDVHACIQELQELINLLKLSSEDHVIFVGDLIHKGPDSPGVLEFVCILQECCKVTVVAGNHEEKQLRWASNEIIALAKGRKNPMQHVEGYREIQENLRPEHIELMRNAVSYCQAEGFTILHGGLAPKARLVSYQLQDLPSISSDMRESAKWLLFTRYVNPQGFPVALNHEQPEDRNWAEVYDGREGTIIFGHQPWMQDKIKIFPNAIGIDTGCVYGNLLTAIEIKDKLVVNQFYVKAHKQYEQQYWET